MTHTVTQPGLSFVAQQSETLPEINDSEAQGNRATPSGNPNGESPTQEEREIFLIQKEKALAELNELDIEPLYILSERVWNDIKKNLVPVYGSPDHPYIKIDLDILEPAKVIAEEKFLHANQSFTMFALAIITTLAIVSTAEVMGVATLMWGILHGIIFCYRHGMTRHFLARELKKSIYGDQFLHYLIHAEVLNPQTAVTIPVIIPSLKDRSVTRWEKQYILNKHGIHVFVHAVPKAVRFVFDPIGFLLREYDKKRDTRFDHLEVMKMSEVEKEVWQKTCPVMSATLHGVIAIIDQWGYDEDIKRVLEQGSLLV